MIKTQIWKPDTCDCEIEQQWDYSTSPANLTVSDIKKHCKSHITSEHTDIVSENQTKNKSLNKVVEFLPQLNIRDITWSFDISRTLVITLPNSISTSQKNTIITLLASISNKIIIL